MSTLLKVVFAFIITLLLGVCVYLGIMYYTESTKPDLTNSQPTSTLKPIQGTEPIKIDSTQAKRYRGEVFCMKKKQKSTPLTTCGNFGITTENGKSYEMVFSYGVSANKYVESQKIEALGVIGSGKSLLLDTPPIDGVLFVSEIVEL